MKLLLNGLQHTGQFLRTWVFALFLLLLTCLISQVNSPIALATGISDLPGLDPAHPTWVIDQAEVISPVNQGKLEKELSHLAETTGNEVRMITVRRLDYGETPDSLVGKLLPKWFATPEAQANQVLVLLDTVTNGTAIKAGEGLTQLLPEDVTNSIAEETMRFPLRDENYNQAFLAASDRLSAILSGQPDPGPPEVRTVRVESTYKSAEETDSRSATLIVVGLLLAATIIPMATYYWYQSNS